MTKNAIVRQAYARLQQDFQAIMPSSSLVAEYYRLLGDCAALTRHGSGILSPDEVEDLLSPQPPEGVIEAEDIPALYFLYQQIHPEIREAYDHIVVDEAQDFSPLQFEILRQNCRRGSMTIAGDLSQGVFAFRGLESWDELRAAFSEDKLEIQNITRSYRSTREITELANRILKRMRGRETMTAESINRSGNAPQIIPVRKSEDLPGAVAVEVRRLMAEGGFHSVAVITKTPEACRALSAELTRLGLPPQFSTTQLAAEDKYTGGLAVMPVASAKGIEFEAVVIPDAGQAAYDTGRPYDGRLLYVAVTRALHHISLFYTAKLSSYLLPEEV